MRAIIQRVSEASVVIDDEVHSAIGPGYLVLLGVGHEDSEMQAEKLWQKILKLRIFQDAQGKTNLNITAVNGSVLIVSQFTLFANCKKGNRPSFIESAAPEHGEMLYKYFVSLAGKDITDVKTGKFGAFMKVELVNDGPFTIALDTDFL